MYNFNDLKKELTNMVNLKMDVILDRYPDKTGCTLRVESLVNELIVFMSLWNESKKGYENKEITNKGNVINNIGDFKVDRPTLEVYDENENITVNKKTAWDSTRQKEVLISENKRGRKPKGI